MDKVDLAAGPGAFSDNELERAAQMGSESLRKRFLGRRWMARQLLAQETGRDPGELTLERRCERCDKLHPATPLHAGGTEVWWSASSSAGVAAIAISDSRIGLDIETIRERARWERIAARFFSAEEQRPLAGSPTRFLEFWTLKEAYLKALGVGLPGGLRALDCSTLLPSPGDWSVSAAHPGWRFQNLHPQPELVAGIAAQGAPDNIELHRWG